MAAWAGSGRGDHAERHGGVATADRLIAQVSTCAADDGRVGLTQGTGANVLVRAESRPAGLQAQQAQKPAVVAGDSSPSSPGRGHRPTHFSQAGPGRHRAACESSQRRSGSIKSRTPSDVVTFHDSLQVPGRTDNQRGMDMIVTEEVPYLTDSGRPRMPCGSRDHRLGGGRHDLIHRSRIRSADRTWSPAAQGRFLLLLPGPPGRLPRAGPAACSAGLPAPARTLVLVRANTASRTTPGRRLSSPGRRRSGDSVVDTRAACCAGMHIRPCALSEELHNVSTRNIRRHHGGSRAYRGERIVRPRPRARAD